MELLAELTLPPSVALTRRHRPIADPVDGYEAFRPCLRWEFGFHCAFCLLHEADLAPGGAKGSGLMWIEHFEPRSRRPDLADEYTNCLYACRWCNLSRGQKPVVEDGVRLLNPCTDAWADYFEIVQDELRAKTTDPMAERTRRAYRLNDPRKTKYRRRRRQLISDRLETVAQVGNLPALREALDREADPQARVALDSLLRRTRAGIRQAMRELAEFAAIPADFDAACGCEATVACAPLCANVV